MSRKRMLCQALLAAVVLLALVSACAPAPTPIVVEKEKVVEKPVVQTVVVEKEKVVEKPVVQTVIVEKEVTVAPTRKTFLDVGKQVPITILIHESPWYKGFERIAKLYEEQTGNKVSLDVSPWSGVLEKARNAVRGAESPYDILNIDQFVVTEFYKGGFLTPLGEIEPGFKFDPQVLRMSDTLCWNEKTQWRDCEGGEIVAFSPNGNVQFLYYRADLYQEAGLKAPETWDDVLQACETFRKSHPDMYCIALGTERGMRIAVDFASVMGGFGGKVEKDPRHGDFTVTINSPEVKRALEFYIRLLKEYGPPDYGAISQSNLIQYMVTGKAVHVVPLATAAWAQMDDPQQSQVVGKVNAVPIPKPADGTYSVFLGSWCMGIPRNIPDERKQAALAFAKWFLTYDAQYEYAKAGAVPVRADVYKSDLATKFEFRWFDAYAKSIPNAVPYYGYPEGAQVADVLGLRLNQAIVGELSVPAALNLAAKEIYEIFKESGRQTGMLEPLAE